MSQLRLRKDHPASEDPVPDTAGAEVQSTKALPNRQPEPPQGACTKVTEIHFTAKAEQLQMERSEARSRRHGLWQRFRDWLDI